MALSKNDSRPVAHGATIQVSMRRKATRRRRRGERRGVILLVIIGLLTLFTLIGLTFVLATSQGSLGAKAASRANRTGTPPPKLHHRALLQIVRGHQNPIVNPSYPDGWGGSVIGPHSLLEDMYGHDSVAAMIPASGFLANDPRFCMGGGSMMYIEIPDINNVPTAGGTFIQLSQTTGYYNGRVITMVDGPARGHSSRITGYEVDLTQTPPTGRLRLLPFAGMTTNPAGTAWQAAGAPQSGNTFLINGRPFNGTGFGYHTGTLATGLLDALDTSPPLPGQFALLPNPTSPAYRTYMYGAEGIYADEDYDAPDFQNMMLAGQFWNTALERWEVRLPSLHRPDLIHYWAAQSPPGSMNNVGHRRKVILRPEPTDQVFPTAYDTNNNNVCDPQEFLDLNRNGVHDAGTEPSFDINGDGAITAGEIDFTGKPFSPLFGPWDVDNDGDGLPDSIWVDPGFEIQTAADGRRYKALAAILCLDLDGRLNINVHGNPNQYRMISPSPGPGLADEEYVTTVSATFPGPYAGAYVDTDGDGRYTPGVDTIVEIRLPIGAGYGVADMSLVPLLSDPYPDSTSATGTTNELRQLLEGRRPGGPVAYAIPGRYGDPRLLYGVFGTDPSPRPGVTSTGAAFHDGLDGTTGTSDDFYYGDDNRPLVPMAYLAGSNTEQFYGNLYHEGYFPGLPLGVNGSPPGLGGNGSVALDLRGQPFYWNSGYAGTPNFPATGAIPDPIDDPYEMDLQARSRYDWGPDGVQGTADDPGTTGDAVGIDAPFTANELEPVLRYADSDASTLPSRIAQLAPLLVDDPTTGALTRRLFTTDSWDLPSPAVVATRDMIVGPDGTQGTTDDLTAVLNGPAVNLHITDLLRARLRQGMFSGTQAQMNAEIANMLAADAVAGLRMDMNRPFGDGLDNDGNGVIDEPAEMLSGLERIWRHAGADGSFGTMDDGPGIAFDANGDGFINAHDSLARYQMAKHIYVLLMLFKDSGYIHPTPDEPAMEADYENTARRLAQWAINAVDFRDRDSIMTPFEYDMDPFGLHGGVPGWNVDGYLGPNPISGADDATHSDRRVVWGCEYPELLITETLAFHDRRSENLDPNAPTPVFGQNRIPQGSAFVELYCTRNPNNPVLQAELYDANGMLDLGRMVGDRPVWRLVVTEANEDDPEGDMATRLSDTSLQTMTAQYQPDSTSVELDDMNLDQVGDQPVIPERIVWFAARAPVPTDLDAPKIYYNQAATGSNLLLPPGQYAVVGPHRRPESGRDNITVVGSTASPPRAQELRLGHLPATNGAGGTRPVIVSDNSGTENYPDDPIETATPGTYDIQEPLGIAVAAPATNWAGLAGGPTSKDVGFSISEPLFSATNYYLMPDDVTNTTIVTHYDGPPPSTIIDRYTMPQPAAFDNDPNTPLGAGGLPHEGTRLNYKTVFLQRLADPTLAWNPELPDPNHDASRPVNPYLTVDWMPFDLTVFNGESLEVDPTLPMRVSDAPVKFRTRQRGVPRDPNVAQPYSNLWQQPDWLDPLNEPQPSTANPTTSNNFKHNLDLHAGHTLGYVNHPWHDATATPPTPAWWTTANLPPVQPGYPPGYTTHVGDPLRPFPWLTWLNRPYASNMELLLVPASSCSRLTFEFDFRSAPTSPGSASDHYVDRTLGGQPPFGHLLNFFHSTDPGPTPPDVSGNYYRVLEYMHVPSRFSGTEELLNPSVFQTGGPAPAVPPPEGAPFYAPFNRVSKYRDPGRVNINTIFDNGRTFQGILNRMQEATYTDAGMNQAAVDPTWNTSAGISQLWQRIELSRHGYDPGGFPIGLNPESPSVLANPFRSFGQTYMVPIETLRKDNTTSSGNLREYVDSSLFRPDVVGSPDNTSIPRPLFSTHTVTGLPYTDYIDSNRNPYFRYQAYQKLGNVFTTRSNVYAIWITVGYFEVERGPIDAVHPDGYRLGQEMGVDTGDIKRDRAFYIYDRSIPVGFRRGENLNVEKGILVERIIE